VNTHLENIRAKLSQRIKENSLRTLKQRPIDAKDFCSNDYLGLASVEAIHSGASEFTTYGATGSRLISGNHTQFEQTENYLAEYYNCESALLFNSGYDANIGVFSTVPQRGDTIIYDELIHASIRDGIRLSHANSMSFKHNDVDDLERKILKAAGQLFVAVESIYSMDGDQSPLKAIIELCKKHGVAIIVDEAHAIGTLGNGRGLVSMLGLETEVFARIITFGKAMGAHGAAVLGSSDLSAFLVNYCRSFIYTTAMPVTSVMAIENAHRFLENNQRLINELQQRVELFTKLMEDVQWKLIPSRSPIQCVVIPGNTAVRNVAEQLQANGFDAKPIMSPTVAKGGERIRICLHVFNSETDINNLVNCIKQGV